MAVEPTAFSVLTFIAGAIHEELAFRGYIEHRLGVVIRNVWVCSALTAGLFLLIHYPIFWALEGRITFTSLSAARAVDILLPAFCVIYRAEDPLPVGGYGHCIFCNNMGVSVLLLLEHGKAD